MEDAAAGTTFTSREFNQDTARAKRAAAKGPVFIKTRGTVSHVLMTKEEFDRRLLGNGKDGAATARPRNLAEMLADPDSADIDFDVPEFKGVSKGFEFD